MVDQNHHYYKLAAMLYPKVVDGMVARGEIAPPEADALMRQLNGPAFTSFVMNVINQIPTLAGEQHMERLIYDNLTVPLVQDMRQQMAANPGYGGGYGYRGGGYGYRAGGYGGGGGWYGRGNPGYGGGCGFGGPSTGGWFGRPNGGPRAAFSARGPGQVTSRTPQQTQQTQTAKPEPKKEPVEWKSPELIKEMNQDIKLGDSVGFAIRKFTASDGCNINEVFVVDDRPVYKNDQEAIQAYKHLLGDDVTTRKFITVCYRQLKVIKVDRPAFKNLIRSVATAIGNIGEHDVAGRFRVLLASSADHPSGAVEAFNKMIVDEFNSHGLCGELLDSVEGHSTWKILASSVHGIYDMLSNNLSKETRETLHQIKNFDEALRVVAEKVLNTVVMNGASQKILDPLNDTTIMDIYGHAVPPVWRNESKGTWEATENLFAKYLASKKRIDGATPETAVVAQQSLKTKLGTIDKNYAVMQVPRIITWCNCPSSTVVGWDNGKCVPRVFGTDTITNDTTFLIDRAIRRVRGSKITAFMGVSSKLICEVDEGSINLDYGVTSDGAVWVGCLRYR